MCGIVGFNWNDKTLVKTMIDKMSHRGPDDFGIYTDNNFSLGHSRLSIIDLSKKGHQPMFNEKKDIVVVFNGEIYNFQPLRQELIKKGHKFSSNTDTEVIVHGYEEYNDNIVQLLDGMFAFAVLDVKKKKILLARDRMGKKPVYYFFNNNCFIFGSEIKSILSYEQIEKKIDTQCLSDYLTMRHSFGERTMFSGIKKLNPGHYMIYQNSEITIKPYWNLPKFSKKSSPSTKILDNLISSSIEKRLVADVPIGVFLSGGLDSSTIIAYLSKFKENIKTFSIGFNDPTDELKYAKIIAEKFRTEHTEIISNENILSNLPSVVWHMDEPLADPAALPTFALSREVSKKVKVVLMGGGGDEVFGGYQDLGYIDTLNLIMKTPRFLRKNIIGNGCLFASDFFIYPNKQKLKLLSQILASKNSRQGYKKMLYLPFNPKEKSNLLLSTPDIKFSTAVDDCINNYKNLTDGAFAYYLKVWLPNNLLIMTDKITMAHALEIRSPFLDTSLIEYSCNLNHKYKKNRMLFRKTVSHMLPDEIMKKKKQGFTLPISNWFCKKDFTSRLMPYFEDLSKRGFFNENYYRKIINNPSGFKNDHRMWVLLNLELWCKIYLDNVDYKKIKID